jgi:hypothetical protein
MNVDPYSKVLFMDLIDKGYQIAKKNLLDISDLIDTEWLYKDVNSISIQIKLIPSYLYLKN